MKRSPHVGLLLMSATPLLLTACSEPVPALVYRDATECKAAGVLSASRCETEHALALSRSAESAPRYTTAKDCEADFGDRECEEAPARHGGGHFFYFPRSSGFVTPDPRDPQHRDNLPRFSSQPLYTAKDDPHSLRNARNEVVARGTGPAHVDADAVRGVAKAATVKRGGFGRVAAARSFGG